MSTQAIAVNAAARQRYLLVLLFAGFVLTGLEITLAGPMLSVFIQRWSLTDTQAGIFSIVQFSASLAGVWLASLLTHYFGPRTPLILGYLFVTVGLAIVNASAMTVALFALAALGLGYGLVVPPTNLGVAQIGGARRASLVSLVNFAWGAGAVSCSPLVLLALKNRLLPQFLIGFAAFGALLTFSFFFAEFPEAHAESPGAETAGERSVGTVITLALAGLFFLYVGVEVSLGYWAAEYTIRLSHGVSAWATIAPMFFYGGLMTGRALAPVILKHVREFRLVLSALLIVLLGGTMLVLASKQPFAFASFTLTGLGCATIFPVCIAWLSHWYGRRASRVSGLMFSMSSIGSFIFPGLVGFVSGHGGGLRIGFLVPLTAAAVMLFLLLLVRRQAAG